MFKQTTRMLGAATPGTNAQKLLSAVPLNGLPATLTITQPLAGKGATTGPGADFVRFGFSLTRGGTVTAVVFTYSVSFDGGVTYQSVTAKSVAGGVATVSPYSDSRSVAGSEGDLLDWIDVRGASHIKVVVSGTGANGADLIDVYGMARQAVA